MLRQIVGEQRPGAVASLVKAGMELSKAAELAGLLESEE